MAVGAFGASVDEVLLLGGMKSGEVVGEAEGEGAVSAEIVGDEKSAVLFGEKTRLNDG